MNVRRGILCGTNTSKWKPRYMERRVESDGVWIIFKERSDPEDKETERFRLSKQELIPFGTDGSYNSDFEHLKLTLTDKNAEASGCCNSFKKRFQTVVEGDYVRLVRYVQDSDIQTHKVLTPSDRGEYVTMQTLQKLCNPKTS